MKNYFVCVGGGDYYNSNNNWLITFDALGIWPTILRIKSSQPMYTGSRQQVLYEGE